MNSEISVTGMVLQSVAQGDYDRRLVLLTRERGKITAFAHGARRPTSMLRGVSLPFYFGEFLLRESAGAYTLVSAKITNYFTKLGKDLEGSCYGSYFLELAGYYGRENLDAAQMLNLLYVSLLALENERLPDRLVRYVFEIRLMVINGEYPQDIACDTRLLEATRYTLQYVITAPLGKLYTFTVKDTVLEEIAAVQDPVRRRTIDMKLKSLDILEAVCGTC